MGLNLVGSVLLDGSGWESGMKRIESATHRTADVVRGLVLGAFGIYGIEQAIHKTVEYGEHITDLSRQVGIGVEKLQEFGYAAKMNGLELDELAGILEKINKNRLNPEKFGSFKKLDLDDTARRLPIEDLVLKLNANVKNRSAQELAGPLTDIGGKSAWRSIAMLKDNIEELSGEAHRLGLVMSVEMAVSMKYTADQAKILAQHLVVSLAPALKFVADIVMWVVSRIKGLGTFAGALSGNSAAGALKDFWNELTAGGLFKGTDMGKVKGWGKQIMEGLAGAAIEYGNETSDFDETWKKHQAELLRKQKEIEDINRLPDFDSVMKSGHGKGKGHELYTDSLLRVGNFLGAGKESVMERIAHTHTHLLTRIANNTDRHHNLTESGGNDLGGGFGHL